MVTSITEPDLEARAAERIAAAFKALGEPVRVRILNILANSGEMCVCDLEEPLGLSQPTVSHHLRVLTQAGLLEREKRGKWVYYSVDFSTLGSIADLLTTPSGG